VVSVLWSVVAVCGAGEDAKTLMVVLGDGEVAGTAERD
jgi:hypothetical protein